MQSGLCYLGIHYDNRKRWSLLVGPRVFAGIRADPITHPFLRTGDLESWSGSDQSNINQRCHVRIGADGSLDSSSDFLVKEPSHLPKLFTRPSEDDLVLLCSTQGHQVQVRNYGSGSELDHPPPGGGSTCLMHCVPDTRLLACAIPPSPTPGWLVPFLATSSAQPWNSKLTAS